jgi:hypothetical protein
LSASRSIYGCAAAESLGGRSRMALEKVNGECQ